MTDERTDATERDSLTLEQAAARLHVATQTLRNYANPAMGYRRDPRDDKQVIRSWPALVDGRARIVYSREDVEAIAALKGL